jgi:hypothetical protein
MQAVVEAPLATSKLHLSPSTSILYSMFMPHLNGYQPRRLVALRRKFGVILSMVNRMRMNFEFWVFTTLQGCLQGAAGNA